MANTISTYLEGIDEWIESQASGFLDNTTKGRLFCRWCLENYFDLSTDSAIDAMEMSGGADHSIDAYIEKNDDKVTVVQTKYGESHSYSEITKFIYDMMRIKEGKVKDSDANDLAHKTIIQIIDAYKKGNDVSFYYITNASFTDTERSKISTLPKSNEFFFHDINSLVEQLEKKQQDIPDSIKGKWLTLKPSTKDMLKFEDTTAVIAVSLSDMYDFVSQGTDDLFASNIRQYLRGTKINAEIKKTIQQAPEQFWVYNNGITIVCDDFTQERQVINVKTPQIVNGCQTAKSILEILGKKPLADRTQIRGHVLVRIIKGADEKQKQDITRYTNTQNAVRGKDFFSLEQFQRKLHDRFKKLGYYYEIQKGSFISLKQSERVRYKGDPRLTYLTGSRFRNMIPAMEAIQAYTAGFKQLPAVSYGHPYELTPGNSQYDTVFDKDMRPEPYLFLYPYLIREWVKQNGYSRGGESWRAHSAHFFVSTYFLICLEVLRKNNLVENSVISPIEVPKNIWDQIFVNEKLNYKLLNVTDDILERYFSDSKIYDDVGNDVRKFLKSQESLTRHDIVLRRLIETVVLSQKNKSLFDSLSSITTD